VAAPTATVVDEAVVEPVVEVPVWTLVSGPVSAGVAPLPDGTTVLGTPPPVPPVSPNVCVVLGIIAVMVAVKVLVEVTISDSVIVCTKLTEAEAVMVPLTTPDTTADCEAVAVLVTIDVTVPVKMATTVPVSPVGVSTGQEAPLADVAPDETVPAPGFAAAVDEVG